MITKAKIDNFIDKIPPSPKILKATLMLLDSGELVKASQIAQQDLALSAYLKLLVNKPIYGFKSRVEDVSQIFGILGVSRSQQAVYNYMISLLSPEKWQLFKLNKNSFHNLQADLSANWQKILTHLNIDDKDTTNAIALLPASIIVSEALFCDELENVHLLRSVNKIDLNTILKRLSGLDLFDICVLIANKWEIKEESSIILQAASGTKPLEDESLNALAQWMHLLLFFTLSQPQYIEAELNDFIDFQVEYIQDIYDEFSALMEIV